MQLIKSVAATALLIAAAVEAKVSFTSTPKEAQVGKSYDISWTDAQGPVTITLKKGKAEDLKTVNVLTSNAADGKYQWVPAGDLAPGDDYALQINSGDELNYSGQFPIKGGKGPNKQVAESSSTVIVETPSSVVAAPTIAPTVVTSGVAAPTGYASASGAAAPSGAAGASGTGGVTGPKPTNAPPYSNTSFKNAASPLALIAGIAAAFALH